MATSFIYTLFKFIHVVAVIVWLGGFIAVGILNARIARGGDPAGIAAFARESEFFGKRVVGISMGVTLVAGIVMMGVARMGVPLWIIWGFVAMLLSGAIGGAVMRKAGQELGRRLTAGNPNDPEIPALQRKLRTFATVNILLLLSAVWMMVFKHTL